MCNRVIGAHWRRPGPHIPIQVLRRRLARRVGVVAHVVVTVNLRQGDFAEFSFTDDRIPSFNKVRSASSLCSNLDNPLVLPGSGHHGLALGNIHTYRLLAKNIRPRLAGSYHGQSMPVVRRGDKAYIQVLFLKHFSVIVVCPPALMDGWSLG